MAFAASCIYGKIKMKAMQAVEMRLNNFTQLKSWVYVVQNLVIVYS